LSLEAATAHFEDVKDGGRHWESGPPAWSPRHRPHWPQLPVNKLALLAAAGLLVWQLTDVLLLAFAAVLIAVILRGLSDAVSARLHIPVRLSLALITVVLGCAVVAIGYWIVPTLLGQASDLGTRLTTQLQTLRDHYGHSPVGHTILSGLSDTTNMKGRVTSFTLGFARNAAGEATWLLMTMIASIYLASEAHLYVRGAIHLLPPHMRPTARHVAAESAHTLRRWLLGQLVDMITVGGVSAIALFWLGVPAPFALAILAGLLTIIPYFGALIAGVAGVLVAMSQSFTDALWVVVIFTGCHVLEGYVLAPLVQRRMVEMPPAVIIISLAVSGTLFGPLGIVLGAPLGVVALVLTQRLYVDRMPDEPGASEATP
jgi:predicted PurR-regulated permease PerM